MHDERRWLVKAVWFVGFRRRVILTVLCFDFMKLRFQLSNLILLVALVAVSLAWYLDHNRLQARFDLVNQEASILAQQRLNVLIHWPSEAQDAKNAWRRTQSNLKFDTYEQRKKIDEGIAGAMVGYGPYRIRVGAGMTAAAIRSYLMSSGFEISEVSGEPSAYRATKEVDQWTVYAVTYRLDGETVVSVDQGPQLL